MDEDPQQTTPPADTSAGHSDNPLAAYEENAKHPDDGQEYVDRSVIDFVPSDGLFSGTAITGDTQIPGPHETADDVESTGPDDESEGGVST